MACMMHTHSVGCASVCACLHAQLNRVWMDSIKSCGFRLHSTLWHMHVANRRGPTASRHRFHWHAQRTVRAHATGAPPTRLSRLVRQCAAVQPAVAGQRDQTAGHTARPAARPAPSQVDTKFPRPASPLDTSPQATTNGGSPAVVEARAPPFVRLWSHRWRGWRGTPPPWRSTAHRLWALPARHRDATARHTHATPRHGCAAHRRVSAPPPPHHHLKSTPMVNTMKLSTVVNSTPCAT